MGGVKAGAVVGVGAIAVVVVAACHPTPTSSLPPLPARLKNDLMSTLVCCLRLRVSVSLEGKRALSDFSPSMFFTKNPASKVCLPADANETLLASEGG